MNTLGSAGLAIDRLEEWPSHKTSPEGPRTVAQLLLPDPGTLFGHAYSAFSLASGLLLCGTAATAALIGVATSVVLARRVQRVAPAA